MNFIKIVDARMGRGKTSAAINYMRDNPNRRFLFVTPYLDEVDRICEACDFDQPEDEKGTKLSQLKSLLRRKKNVASTHALFLNMDDACIELITSGKYSLIVDEAINVIYRLNIPSGDRDTMIRYLVTIGDDNFVHWKQEDYVGALSPYKAFADRNSLFYLDGYFLYIMNPKLFTCFDEIIMMTYLFRGQYLRGYLEFFGLEYKMCGISTTQGYRFVDEPDVPPPIDYSRLIHIVDDKLNNIGEDKFSLSRSWYERRSGNNESIKQLVRNLRTFFQRRCEPGSGQLWTCFKDSKEKLIGDRGRFKNGFLQLSARATNAYKERTAVAYLVNRFADPNITKLFSQKDINIDPDEYALGEMLQFIWRSAIRDDKPINVYVPSKRMRTLLLSWIEENSEGGG